MAKKKTKTEKALEKIQRELFVISEDMKVMVAQQDEILSILKDSLFPREEDTIEKEPVETESTETETT